MHEREHHVHLPADEILHRAGEALVRHVRRLEAQAQLDELHADVMRRAVAGRSEEVFAGVLADERDRLRHVVCRKDLRVHREAVGGGGDLADRREVFDDVVGRVLDERRRDGEGVHRHHERVAVGRRLRDEVGADVAARPGLVFHDHGLAPFLGELRPDDAREDVDAGAGRERHDERHRARGKRLRQGAR